jgi:hypothetical protein
MQSNKPYARHLVLTALVVGLASAASSAFAAAPTDAQARANWNDVITHVAAPSEGCFHATYPETKWVKDQCFQSPHRYLAPPRRNSQGKWETVGNGNDDVIEVSGHQISEITGTFPTVTGVKTEKGVGVSAFGGGGILGANEYTLQINSGIDKTTAACKGKSGCVIWEQYVYSPDYDVQGSAAVFIEYWLLGYGSTCPSGSWQSDGSGDCVYNSNYTSAPDEPITQLSKEKFTGSAASGGNDVAVFTDGSTAYTFSAKDSALDLGTAWDQSEFNVVGNAGGSKADFNSGSSVTVKIAANDGSTATPTCLKEGGTTGETNNLTLKSCTATGGSTPYIEFVESN